MEVKVEIPDELIKYIRRHLYNNCACCGWTEETLTEEIVTKILKKEMIIALMTYMNTMELWMDDDDWNKLRIKLRRRYSLGSTVI